MAKSPKKTSKPQPQTTPSFWEIGKNYLIRGVTMYQVGRLVAIDAHELILADAAWVADTGHFNEALKTGTFNEVEPFIHGPIAVGRGQIVDASLFPFALPIGVK